MLIPSRIFPHPSRRFAPALPLRGTPSGTACACDGWGPRRGLTPSRGPADVHMLTTASTGDLTTQGQTD